MKRSRVAATRAKYKTLLRLKTSIIMPETPKFQTSSQDPEYRIQAVFLPAEGKLLGGGNSFLDYIATDSDGEDKAFEGISRLVSQTPVEQFKQKRLDDGKTYHEDIEDTLIDPRKRAVFLHPQGFIMVGNRDITTKDREIIGKRSWAE